MAGSSTRTKTENGTGTQTLRYFFVHTTFGEPLFVQAYTAKGAKRVVLEVFDGVYANASHLTIKSVKMTPTGKERVLFHD